MRLHRRHNRLADSGAVAIVVAISTLALFGVSALAVDIGQLYNVHRSSQTTADLAALAGAAKLPGDPQGACQTAIQFLLKNQPSPESFSLSPADCGPTGTADGQTVKILAGNSQIQVTVPQRQVGFGFAALMGFNKGYTAATATAAIRSPGALNPFAVSTGLRSGLQCIHDNSNGHSDVTRAALIAPMAPNPTGLSPASGPVSETTAVTVQGTGFSNQTDVIFDGVKIASSYNNQSDTLTFTAPSTVTTPKTVTVVLQDKQGSTTTNYPVAGGFTYQYVTPSVSGVSPSTEIAGATVTVNGQHLSGATSVSFGGSTATPTNVTPTSLTVVVPPGAANSVVDVTVTNPAGTSTQTANDKFTYKPTPAPTVTQVAPSAGVTAGGTVVTITGSGFTTPATVKFGANPATNVVVNSSSSITATSPAGSGTVDVVVTTTAGSSATTTADQFTYGPAPTVTSVTPDFGPSSGGTAVTIQGSNFTIGSSVVFFGSNQATSVVVVNATTITALTPSGTGSVTVSVTNAFSASSGGPTFTYYIDDCTSATGNFGYLDVPRSDTNTNVLETNIIKGMDHIPGIFPAASLPPLVDTKCLNGSTPIPGAKLDNPPNNLINGVNCLDVENGNKVSSATQALLDGINNPNLNGKLYKPAVPPNQMNGQVAGRDNIDTDSIRDFIAPGHTFGEFLTAIQNELTGHSTIKFFKAEIVQCPRFAILPVLHISQNPQNGLYPVVGFVGAFIEAFQTSGNNSQVQAIQAWTFPLDWLPDVIGQSVSGTTDYIGSGPVIPLLVK